MVKLKQCVYLLLQSIPPRPFPKIPAKLLRDSSPYGALYSIASKCYEITKQRGLKKIDFANPAKRKEVSCHPAAFSQIIPSLQSVSCKQKPLRAQQVLFPLRAHVGCSGQYSPQYLPTHGCFGMPPFWRTATLLPSKCRLAMAVCKHYCFTLLEVEDWCKHDLKRLGDVYSCLLARNFHIARLHMARLHMAPHGSPHRQLLKAKTEK